MSDNTLIINDQGVTIIEDGVELMMAPVAIGTDAIVPANGLALVLGAMSFGSGLVTLTAGESVTAALNAINVAIHTADYQSGSDVDTAIASALSSYVTASALTTALNSYVTTSALTSTLVGYVTSSSLSTTLIGYATTSALTTAINGEVTNRNAAISSAISGIPLVTVSADGLMRRADKQKIDWLGLTSYASNVLTFNPVSAGDVYFFNNTVVRAYQFDLNGRVLLTSDIVDNFAFQSTANSARYADFDISTARSLVIRNVDGDPTIIRVGTLLADLAVKVGGGQVAISESPAGAMQFTLPDLSTRIPLYASGLHLDASNVWESGSLNCQIMTASLALAFQSPAGSFVGFGTNKILNLLSDWSFGWLPTTTGNCTDPSTPSDALLTRADTGAVSVSDRAGHSIGLSAIVPTSSASAGQAGQLAADASFNYRHDGTQWKRAPVTYSTF